MIAMICEECSRIKYKRPDHKSRFCSPQCYGVYARRVGQKAGKNNPNFGRHHSDETKKLIATRALGRVPSTLTRLKISQTQKGKLFSAETRKKISEALIGEKHPRWCGGVAKLRLKIWRSHEYQEWRNAVLKRDAYRCQLCGAHDVPLHADHIKSFAEYPELRTTLSNGRALCAPCHRKTPNYGRTSAIRILQKAA